MFAASAAVARRNGKEGIARSRPESRMRRSLRCPGRALSAYTRSRLARPGHARNISTVLRFLPPECSRLLGLAADAHIADLEIGLRAIPHAALLILEHVTGAALAIGRRIFHDLASRRIELADRVGVHRGVPDVVGVIDREPIGRRHQARQLEHLELLRAWIEA